MCMIFRHKYSKWKVFNKGNLITPGIKLPTGYYISQIRECEKCGKIQIREIKE
jgi:hypothetical protein